MNPVVMVGAGLIAEESSVDRVVGGSVLMALGTFRRREVVVVVVEEPVDPSSILVAVFRSDHEPTIDHLVLEVFDRPPQIAWDARSASPTSSISARAASFRARRKNL